MTENVANGSEAGGSRPSVRSPEIFDPYLGRVYGNVLDLYDTPAYNIKFALVKDKVLSEAGRAAAANSSVSSNQTSSDPRADTPTTGNTTGTNTSAASGAAPKSFTKPVAAGDMVVIAQTGVTGILIDDVIMETGLASDANYWPTSIELKLIQPGMANLMDQMQIAKKWLDATGIARGENTNTRFLSMIEISFMGRKADPDDEDIGGNPTVVDGPYGWICTINAIDIKVDQTGSYYLVKLTPYEGILYNDRDFRVPHEVQCTGKTVKEAIENFQNVLNASLRSNLPADYTDPDEYFFDTSSLLGSSAPLLPIATPLRSSSNPDVNNQGAISSGQVRAELRASETTADSSLVNTGRAEPAYQEYTFTVAAKTDFYNFFVKLLSVCDDFVNRISNLENINDPNSPAKRTAAMNWISVDMDVEYKKFDKKRNDYTKKIIVRPVIYETGRPDLHLKLLGADNTSQESRNQENAATFRLQQLRRENKLLKSYKYLFTGLNDQILNLELKFDPGTTILQAPRNGMIGDTELITAPMMNPTQPLNQDLSTVRGLLGAVDKLRDAAKFADVLRSLSDGQIGNIARSLGITAVADVETLKNSIRTGTQQAATDLANRIGSQRLNQVAQAATAAQAAAGAGGPPRITNPDGTTYDPESSGVTYAEDLLTDIMERAGGLTLEQIQQAGLIRTGDLDAFNMVPPVSTDPTPASSGPATSMIARRGSPSNVLFNYIYTKQAAPAAFLNIEMTIRGDPWYLGSVKGRSTADAGAFNQSSQPHVLLQVATPPPFDLDLNDEDNNSGYWNMNGLSNSFSGVYLLTRVVNKFQNGMFTSTIYGSKQFDVPLFKIRPMELRFNERGERITFDLNGIGPDGRPISASDNANANLARAPAVTSGTGGTSPSTGGPPGAGVTGTNTSTAPDPTTGHANPLGNARATITSDFGERIDPQTRQRKFHGGIDIAAPEGTRIFPSAPGRVVRVESDFSGSLNGNAIWIDHGNGLETAYIHMVSPTALRVGDTVTGSTVLGGVGSTGKSTGNHLHFQAKLNGRVVNPRNYIRF